MKQLVKIGTTAVLALTLSAGLASAKDKYAWYASTVHPYFDEVQKGVDQFAADYDIEVFKRLGQDWTQDNENENVEAMAAQGYNAFSIFPADVSGARGLYEELTARGVDVVDFGQATTQPTTASFYVGTQLKEAAIAATEELIAAMGGSGNILNVLEVPSEATLLRKEGVEEVVAATDGVEIIQEVADMTTIEESIEKIQSALAANLDDINGIIATGYTPTVAIAQILTEHHENGGRRIHFFGIDTDATVIDAIRAGHIDGTMAQNPYGHGYISMVLLKYLKDGYSPRDGVHAIDAGVVPVTKDNVDTYAEDVATLTKGIIDSLETEYLTK